MKTKAKNELLEFSSELNSSEESQSEDDEAGWMLTEEVEKEFYNTLTKIKNKDPKIYEKGVEFFKDIQTPEKNGKKESKTKPLTLQDYERKMIIEKGAEWSDEDSEVDTRAKEQLEPTYVEEQEAIKKSFKLVMNSDDDDDEQETQWAGFLKKREKAPEEKKTEDEDFNQWLKEQGDKLEDEKAIEPLKDSKTNSDLNEEEDKFLQDYIFSKKFLDNGEEDIPEKDYEAEKSEERDQEFIKRYPRSMENSLRRKNESRKNKRDEVRERKLKEKEKKKAEIKNKKKLKRQEIEDKIEELKKLTGNDQLAFENVLEQDFDTDEYDKAMQRLFNDEFYCQDDPNFKHNDTTGCDDAWNEEEYEETGEIEEYENLEEMQGPEKIDNETINCEDPNFNMDCDYDPSLEKPKEKGSRSRRRKDKHRRTTVSEAVNREKPTFDPTSHSSFQDYVDQYYAIDCEDFIGDLACRFKYRRTVPNSYGLSIEEILAADEKELERWCSIKRMNRLKQDFKEKGDLKVFQKKAADEILKRKILPSLFKTSNEDNDMTMKQSVQHEKSSTVSSDCGDNVKEKCSESEHLSSETKNSEIISKSENHTKSKKKKKNRKLLQIADAAKQGNVSSVSLKRQLETTETFNSKKKKRSINQNNHFVKPASKFGKNFTNNRPKEQSTLTEMSDARLLAYGIKPKKFRNKLKYSTDT